MYRLSAHNLNIESGRYMNVERHLRFCNNCNLGEIDDEYHFILVCTSYSDIRTKYIKPYYWRHSSVFKLVKLLSSRNAKELNNLGKYLCIATSRHNN